MLFLTLQSAETFCSDSEDWSDELLALLCKAPQLQRLVLGLEDSAGSQLAELNQIRFSKLTNFTLTRSEFRSESLIGFLAATPSLNSLALQFVRVRSGWRSVLTAIRDHPRLIHYYFESLQVHYGRKHFEDPSSWVEKLTMDFIKRITDWTDEFSDAWEVQE